MASTRAARFSDIEPRGSRRRRLWLDEGTRRAHAQEIWDKYRPDLIADCTAIVRDEVAAREIVDECFTRLFARLGPARDPMKYLWDQMRSQARRAGSTRTESSVRAGQTQ